MYIFVLYLVATALDIFTTTRALKSPNLKEGNPIIAYLMDKLGFGWVVVKVVVSGFAAWLLVTNDGLWVLAALTTLIFYVSYRNYKIAK